MKLNRLVEVGTLAAAGALALAGVSPANAATFTTGHTDIVSVACDAGGNLSVDTYREDVGHISPADIGTHTFAYDQSTSNGALTYSSNLWTASGDEIHEDDIPFIGFQYASAVGASCPANVSFDVSKVTGSTNTGTATFTANVPSSGSTSSATGNTSKVTVWKPGTVGKESHQHGVWTFAGPAAGGSYTLKFDVYKPGLQSAVGTISPVNITVQP